MTIGNIINTSASVLACSYILWSAFRIRGLEKNNQALVILGLSMLRQGNFPGGIAIPKSIYDKYYKQDMESLNQKDSDTPF